MKHWLKRCFLLWLDQILSIVGAILIFGFLGAWQQWIITTICSVLCIYLALLLPYHDSWKTGASDYAFQKREGGTLVETSGIVVGAISAIPSLLIATLGFVCAISGYSLGEFMGQAVSEFIYRIWFFPFAPVFAYLEYAPILYFLPVLVLPLTSGFGYYMGSKKLFLRDYLYYQREKKER